MLKGLGGEFTPDRPHCSIPGGACSEAWALTGPIRELGLQALPLLPPQDGTA